VLDGYRASFLKAIGDAHRVDTSIEKSFALLEQGTSKYNHTRRPIAYFIILRTR
jgi:hypothetical protein